MNICCPYAECCVTSDILLEEREKEREMNDVILLLALSKKGVEASFYSADRVDRIETGFPQNSLA